MAASPAHSAQDSAVQAAAPTFIVNNAADAPAAAPLNSGPCETAIGNNVCTLRAAIMKANNYPAGGATVRFGLPGAVTYFLTIPKITNLDQLTDESTGDLIISSPMNIVGNGAGNTIIDGNGSITHDRVLHIPSNGIAVNISGVTIRNGRGAGLGGGIVNIGNLTIDNSAIISNKTETQVGSPDWGGGIWNYFGTLKLNRTVVSGNSTGNSNPSGGGIYNEGGPLEVIDSTISNNVTSGPGGGIYSANIDAMVRNSTISGNSAQFGGGIYAGGQTYVTVRVVNSTISGNFANVHGGGIYNAVGIVELFNVTITQNQANADGVGSGTGGGIYNTAFTPVNVANSIIAFNEAVIDRSPFDILDLNECSGTLTSQGNNLMYLDEPARCTVNGAVVYADPRLGPLLENGGPTKTHALLNGSPAIDTGNIGGCKDNLNAPLTTDQRGAPRSFPSGGRCDIGAFESGPLATLDVDASITATKYDALTDGLLSLRYLFGLTGPTLTAGALGGTASRTDPSVMKGYLDGIRIALDVDGNGNSDALTDGLLIMRYLFGLRGGALIAGAVDTLGRRTTTADIETYVQSLMP